MSGPKASSVQKKPELEAALERAARGLRAGREFINALPLHDGASQRAKDREFIALTLIPDGLMALDEIAAYFLDYRTGEEEADA